MRSQRAAHYAALFDLDGVIIDTRAATQEALRTLAAAAAEAVDPAVLGACVMLPPVDALRSLGVTEAPKVYRDHFDSALALAVGELRVFGPVVSGIAALAEAGIGIGIVTAQARSRLRYLLPPAVSKLVDIVIAHEDAPAKPAPDGVLAACAYLGVPVERALFVGDTPTDIKAGQAAGVSTVGAGWGFGGEAILRQAGVDVLLATPDQVGPQMFQHLKGRPIRPAVRP